MYNIVIQYFYRLYTPFKVIIKYWLYFLCCTIHPCSLFILYIAFCISWGFPCGSDSRETACNAGDQVQSLSGEDPPGEGNGNPLQCSCLENPMDRRAWRAAVHAVEKSWTQLRNEHNTLYLLTPHPSLASPCFHFPTGNH